MVVKPQAQKTEQKKTPIKVFRSGQVKASVWENDFQLKDGTMRKSHSVTVIRSYKDGDEWKDTNSYNQESLADLVTVADESRKFLKLKDQ